MAAAGRTAIGREHEFEGGGPPRSRRLRRRPRRPAVNVCTGTVEQPPRDRPRCTATRRSPTPGRQQAARAKPACSCGVVRAADIMSPSGWRGIPCSTSSWPVELSSNSMASIGFLSLKARRSALTRLYSSGSQEHLLRRRVPQRLMSIAGYTRLSTSRRSSTISLLPVPLNSSKITSSILLPVSTSAVAMIVSEPLLHLAGRYRRTASAAGGRRSRRRRRDSAGVGHLGIPGAARAA